METMIHSLTALSISILIIGMLIIVFFPEKGILARWNRTRKNTERILIEDALKHIYDCEYNDTDCTLHSIAGNLAISGDRTAKLTEKLMIHGLIESHTGYITLTDAGRSYALRVIRLHRLWERYLADQTGVDENDWHSEAEIKEHAISPDEETAIAAQLGNPLTDPHGDPIPSSSGTVMKQHETPICKLKKGEYGRIVHIEDEPPAIYSQLVALGLHPGMQVRIIDQNDERLTIEADGNECILAPLFAGHIHITPIHHTKDVQHNFQPLSSLEEGEEAQVVAISRKIRGQQRRRLMDLGLVPGTSVTAVMKSVGNDPVAYKIRGALIALRNSQTNGIFIERKEEKQNETTKSM